MGLIIQTFKKGGITFSNCYAKVMTVSLNNSAKVALFSVGIYPQKGDNNIISSIENLNVVYVREADIVSQCYASIEKQANKFVATKEELEAKINNATTEDDSIMIAKLRLESISNLEIIQLAGADTDE